MSNLFNPSQTLDSSKKLLFRKKQFVRFRTKQLTRLLISPYTLLTSSLRSMPSFIIIGAPKCGTTSLYGYLIQHPNVKSAFQKELNFFNAYFDKGIAWYHFKEQ